MKKIVNKTKNWNNKNTDDLCDAILMLKNKDELKNLLRDLLTPNEIVEFGNRLKSAKMLKNGVHYNAIAEATGLSSRTIARVQHWLKKGMGGYRKVLSKSH